MIWPVRAGYHPDVAIPGVTGQAIIGTNAYGVGVQLVLEKLEGHTWVSLEDAACMEPSGFLVKATQTLDFLGHVVYGAAFGSNGLGAEMAGDVALSLIPGLGVYTNIRDVIKNSLKALPLGLGEPDYREMAIAGLGILAEVLPPADLILNTYRTFYKIAKGTTSLMPLFLAFEPIALGALNQLWDYAKQHIWLNPTPTTVPPPTPTGSGLGGASGGATAFGTYSVSGIKKGAFYFTKVECPLLLVSRSPALLAGPTSAGPPT